MATALKATAVEGAVPANQPRLIRPVAIAESSDRPVLVYFPGSDGTGCSIAPQLQGLLDAGWDVRCLYIPMEDRSDWPVLVASVVPLLQAAVDASPGRAPVTLVAESFGGALALRVAAAAPQLLSCLVVVNPATSFARSYGGLPALVAATSLLSLFPEGLYNLAQAVLVPFLVDKDNIGAPGMAAIRRMMIMDPPPAFQLEHGFVDPSKVPGAAQRRRDGGFYLPAATASWRLRLLRTADMSDAAIASIRVPTLVVASARDRLLPSLAEAGRLVSLIPGALRVVLPDSGHTALLESSVHLASIMRRAGFAPEQEHGVASSAAAARRRRGFDADFDRAALFLNPLRGIIAPMVLGTENLPDPLAAKARPLLFVGNHTRFGLYDLPFLVCELYLRGFKVRGLAHEAHWQGPLGSTFERFGAVKATPRAAFRLLQAGEAVLLFPGGGREVNKRKGEEYQLIWKDQPDFVRMAAKLNALVIPFAAVGGDDAYDLLLDTDEVLDNPLLGPLVRGALRMAAPSLDPAEVTPPIGKDTLLGLPTPVPLPRLERLYFQFMEPIDPAVEGALEDPVATYADCRASVERGLTELQAVRAADPERPLLARLAAQARRAWPALDLAWGLPGGPPAGTAIEGRLYWWSYVYYLSKYYELIDTVLLGLKAKPMSFLHVFHHSIVVIMAYLWLEAAQSLQQIALLTNTAIHTLMYWYYFMCTLKRPPAWKRLVTSSQIAQFCFSFVASVPFWILHARTGKCSGFMAMLFNAAFNLLLLGLFMDFHRKNYRTKRKISGTAAPAR
ncbi:hypothetical protein WJX81_004455 [Elliptochloris bilobata]|uniref:Phospholipid/glycerol acyltransferase domain-containing protein n=1 Tax=Elliptochloris bilobata TaxID=381761 RepID=A0AAW1RDZ0_9CHLO